MMLTPMVHELFDELNIWLTPLEVGLVSPLSVCRGLTAVTRLQDHGNVVTNQYKVNCSVNDYYPHFHPTVTFGTHALPNGKTIEPPSPQLTALHAVCAQIAHISGAAERLEETFRDTEDIPIMTATPNSVNELIHALTKVQLKRPSRDDREPEARAEDERTMKSETSS
jgi:hypothetical protein